MSDWFSDDKRVKHKAFRRIAAMVCPAEGCDEVALQVRAALCALRGCLDCMPAGLTGGACIRRQRRQISCSNRRTVSLRLQGTTGETMLDPDPVPTPLLAASDVVRNRAKITRQGHSTSKRRPRRSHQTPIIPGGAAAASHCRRVVRRERNGYAVSLCYFTLS